MSVRKVLIAAGGTGGHIYPALAIADALTARSVHVEFVGTALGLENKLIPPKGYSVHHLPIGRLNRNVGFKERILTVLRLPLALVQSMRLLRRYRPDLVLGVGGHASGPLLLAAAWMGYRSAIWEPNAMPGLANRLLARFVDECWVVFDEARRRLSARQIEKAGMPVRREIESVEAQSESNGIFRVLVFGGSQGARGLNSAVLEMVGLGAERLRGVRFVHQTGPVDFTRVQQAYLALPNKDQVDVRDYLNDMDRQYAAADLVICRSGTGTLSELAACGRPAILVPLPTAADDHQRINAESLVNAGAAVMILQKDLSGEHLLETVESLRRNPERRMSMAKAVRGFHQPRAAEQLADKFLERMNAHASS